MKCNKLTTSKLIWSMVLIIAFWAILREIDFAKTFFGFVSDETWQGVFEGVLRRIIWIAPVIWLIKHYESDLKVNFKDMFLNRINFKLFSVFFGFFTIYTLASMFVAHGGFHINKINFWAKLITFITVGFVEELAYRGWALNAFSKFMSDRKANFVSSIFFLLLHYPAYISHWFTTGTLNMSGTNNVFELSGFLFHTLLIVIWGLIFGYVFRKNKSVTSPMILHSYYDLIIEAFGKG